MCVKREKIGPELGPPFSPKILPERLCDSYIQSPVADFPFPAAVRGLPEAWLIWHDEGPGRLPKTFFTLSVLSKNEHLGINAYLWNIMQYYENFIIMKVYHMQYYEVFSKCCRLKKVQKKKESANFLSKQYFLKYLNLAKPLDLILFFFRIEEKLL